MNRPRDDSPGTARPVMWIFGAPLAWRETLALCLPGYELRHIPGRLPGRGVWARRGLRRSAASPANRPVLATWSMRDGELAQRLAGEFGLPLYILEPGPCGPGDCRMAGRSILLYPAGPGGFWGAAAKMVNGEAPASSALLDSASKLMRLQKEINGQPETQGKAYSLLVVEGDEPDAELADLAELAQQESPGLPVRLKALRRRPGGIFRREMRRRGIPLETGPLYRLLAGAGQVYTIRSVAALYARMLGLPLVVTRPAGPEFPGAAGAMRLDEATPSEPFNAFFLSCSRYPASPSDPVRGALAAALAAAADEVKRAGRKRQFYLWVLAYILRAGRSFLGETVDLWPCYHAVRRILSKLLLVSPPPPPRWENALPPDQLYSDLLEGLRDGFRCRGQLLYRLHRLLKRQKPENRPAGHPAGLDRRYPVVPPSEWQATEQKAKLSFEARDLERAQTLVLRLFRSACIVPELFLVFVHCRILCFQFAQAGRIAIFAARCFPFWRSAIFMRLAARYFLMAGEKNAGLRCLADAYFNLQWHPLIDLHDDRLAVPLRRLFGSLPWQEALVDAKRLEYRKKSPEWAMSLLNAGCLDEAERVCRGLRPATKKQTAAILKTYTAQGKFKEARALLQEKMGRSSARYLYDEALSLSITMGDRGWMRRILAEAKKKRIPFRSHAEQRIACYALGNIQQAYLILGQAPHLRLLQPYFKEKMLPPGFLKPLPCRTALVLSECFLGDEIRYSRLYPRIAKSLNADAVTFTCDPRLSALLRRTFPFLDFLPVHRLRELDMRDGHEAFANLPGADLSRYLDNQGWLAANGAERLVTVIHALPEVVHDYRDLENLPPLLADPVKAKSMGALIRDGLPRGERKVLAGLSWRSFLSDRIRRQNIPSLEELAWLFALEGVQWINCQYDGATPDEMEFIERNFPGRLITLPEVDQFHDVDGTAALYSCLSFMVSAPTYVADLSSALGTPTLSLSKTEKNLSFCAPGAAHHAFADKYEIVLCGGPSSLDRQAALERIKRYIAASESGGL